MPSGPPPPGYFPPSVTACDVNAAPDASQNPADHVFPGFQYPAVGQKFYLVQNGVGGHGQIRAVIISGTQIIAKIGLPSDPTVPRATYTTGMRYRLELCQGGAFVPITAPITAGKASYNGASDFWTETYGSELTQPTPSNILISISWRWDDFYMPTLHIEAKHKCEGIGFQVATNYATASITPYPGHAADAKNLVDTIGVTMHYDGSAVSGGPGVNSGSGDGEGLPGPGESQDPTPAGAGGGISGFPYGAPISKSLSHDTSVEVSDQIRAVLIDVCNGFTATGVVKFTDGRTIAASVHSK